jgi:hypothetical protein
MIEAFKTNIDCGEQALHIIKELKITFTNLEISVDLDDCDKVLRIEGDKFNPAKVISILTEVNVDCYIMEG